MKNREQTTGVWVALVWQSFGRVGVGSFDANTVANI